MIRPRLVPALFLLAGTAIPCAGQVAQDSATQRPPSEIRPARMLGSTLVPRTGALAPATTGTSEFAGSVGSVVHPPSQAPPDRWFASDKLRHFFLSFGATGFASAGARAIGAEEGNARRIGIAAAAAAGIGKEIADHRHGWGFSLRDLVWDAAGIAAAILVNEAG